MTNQKSISAIDEWRLTHASSISNYFKGNTYIKKLPPQVAVQLPAFQTLEILFRKLGTSTVGNALNPNFTIASPVANKTNANWIKNSNIVGVNIRTIDNFFNLVKYALTLSDAQDCIHILPIWEPGVVNSLYGKVSWNINPEFYSPELERVQPHLNTVEKQLKACINMLHAMGKTVGMDVIPHCDRFSEIVLSHPRYFEWVQILDAKIVRHNGNISTEVEDIIFEYLKNTGTANGHLLPNDSQALFKGEVTEEERNELLFGYHWDTEKRERRRIEMMQAIISRGFETLPVTMAPPYRGLHLDNNSFEIDNLGNKWYEFKFDHPQEMSRVFGPLTRYKFHETQDNSWELDFNKPCKEVWEYFSSKYAECQAQYNFDYMRGDMAHIQPRPQGVPTEIDPFYDPLLFTKKAIQQKEQPHFAFYAETFLAHDNYMSYGSEIEHLNAIETEATLGDLQSCVFGSSEFKNKLKSYLEWAKTENFAPTLTIITSDKDDPRFDKFYRKGNIARFFLGYLFTDLPSYFSLGFETRAKNLKRNKNESYTKLFVFTIHNPEEKDKVTSGPFEWGENWEQLETIDTLKDLLENIYRQIKGQATEIIQFEDYIIWTQKSQPKFIFTLSFSENKVIKPSQVQSNFADYKLTRIYNNELDFQCSIYEVEES